ncbi:MAG: hypothetical protein QF893_00945 [Alphaproteobacteria bacterium]|nr:hypothetical protein [Alphaproteobacteria bacterium]
MLTVHYTKPPLGPDGTPRQLTPAERQMLEQRRARESAADRTGTWEGGMSKVEAAISGTPMTRGLRRPSMPVGTKQEFLDAIARLEDGDTLYINAHGSAQGIGVGTEGSLWSWPEVAAALRDRPRLAMVVVDACALGARREHFATVSDALNAENVLGWTTYAQSALHVHSMSAMMKRLYKEGGALKQSPEPAPMQIVGRPFLYSRKDAKGRDHYGKSLRQVHFEIVGKCPDIAGSWEGNLKFTIVSGSTNIKKGMSRPAKGKTFVIRQEAGSCDVALDYRNNSIQGAFVIDQGFDIDADRWTVALDQEAKGSVTSAELVIAGIAKGKPAMKVILDQERGTVATTSEGTLARKR